MINWNYSRSLLYTLAEPTYHTGLRATYPMTTTLDASANWLNGRNTNVLPPSGMRSFAGAVSWWPASNLETVATYAGGLERVPYGPASSPQAYRHEVSTYAVYKPRSWLNWAATLDYGTQPQSGRAQWWGIGGYMRCRFLPWLAGDALRGERYADPLQGFTTMFRQHLAEATVTMEATTHVGAVALRGQLEYRRDNSDLRRFPSSPHGLTHQDTSTQVGLTAAF